MASHNNASWHTAAEGFLEHSLAGEACNTTGLPSRKLPGFGNPRTTNLETEIPELHCKLFSFVSVLVMTLSSHESDEFKR